MGTCIESVATTSSHHRLLARGTVGLSDEAARVCLDRALRRPDELDLLVNAGIYKEKNMAEPALASIIQEDIGANLGHPSRRGHHGTFSFDVLDGACGCLSAAYFIDAFVRDGSAKLAMIVASDARSSGVARGFPFDAVGGALLLRHREGAEGFDRFEFRAFPEFAGLFRAQLRWDPDRRTTFHATGRNVLEVREEPTYAVRCVECAVVVASSFLANAALRGDAIDLLVASEYPPQFSSEVARALSIAEDRVAHADPARGVAHTAGPLVALERATLSGRLARARNVLFVTAGAGISVGVALYRK